MLAQDILLTNPKRVVKSAIKNVPFPWSKPKEKEDTSVKTLPKGTVLRCIGVVTDRQGFLLFKVVSCRRKELEGRECWLSSQEVCADTSQ